MKILLVGEYSRLHNSLKEGLIALGHEVTLIGSGDAFKKYPVDLPLTKKYNSGFLKKIKILLYRLFKVDISSLSIQHQFFSYAEKLKGFDVVQLINESPFGVTPSIEKKLISFLKQHNKKLFLLSCGTDYVSVQFAFEKKLRYSIMTPFFDGKITKKKFAPVLKYLEKDYKELYDFVYQQVEGVIASDLDYHLPLEGHTKYAGLIPNPINTEKMKFSVLNPSEKVIIFHGINRNNYFKKGNDYFEAALGILSEKYKETIEIITVENVPYATYITLYDTAHIVLDQVFAYDQGYNALEAMAKGKVVFTGAETEFLQHYHLTEPVAVNALPDVPQLVAALEALIEDPQIIQTIGKNARAFIEEHHDYKKIAATYVTTWKNY